MDSFLTTLYFAYFRARQRIENAKLQNQLPKAEGAFDDTSQALSMEIERGQEIEALLTEYTLILKGSKPVKTVNVGGCRPHIETTP